MAGKRYSGSSMVNISSYKRFNGSSWVNCVGKRWDGTKWVIVTKEPDTVTGIRWTFGTTGVFKSVFANIETTYPYPTEYRLYDVTSSNWIRDWNSATSNIDTGHLDNESFSVRVEVRYYGTTAIVETKTFSYGGGGGTVTS